ncbi:hypothetical protein EBO34_05850 [Alteribacter keqinensis]|uniref:Uncharacterized protein n=1 Tax=Alteribacter keqinensis TaxID=2483800 RepID=A0A3M7TV66_9BACI|nr:hypothetical protein EBO34_05850 [Alteribacter keqinensis]
MKSKGETPQCVARGGSPAFRGKRSIFQERFICTAFYSFGFSLSKTLLSQPLSCPYGRAKVSS